MHPLPEYPRPAMRRDSYENLNGLWKYAITQTAEYPAAWDGSILVPYSPETKASGVGRTLQPGQWLHTHNVKTNLSGEIEYAYNPTHPVVEPVEAELAAATHLVNESLPRLLQFVFSRMSEIYQVTVMGQYRLRKIAVLAAGPAKSLDGFRFERGRTPLALVLGKEGETSRPYSMGIHGSVLYAARSAHMCSKILFHSVFHSTALAPLPLFL